VWGAVTEVLHGFEAANRDRVAALRAQGRFFWLDVSLTETSRDDLIEGLGIPEHALRAPTGSGDELASRRSHADRDSVVFTFHCYVESESADEAAYRLRPIEVRVVVTGDYLLTAHEERVSLPEDLAPDLPEERSERYVVYSVLDGMVARTFDALEEVELQLEALAEAMTEDGSGGRLSRSTLRSSGARLTTMRRWVRAEQAVFERIGVEVGKLRGFTGDDEPDFDRLDDELNRLLSSIDAAANAMGVLLDLQLNERAYVVSLVATIFVPLTFITGFFGMNFGWMIDHIDTPVAFWLLGFIIPIAAGALSWRFLARRFVMGPDRTARRR
jgi:magnesium transporter